MYSFRCFESLRNDRDVNLRFWRLLIYSTKKPYYTGPLDGDIRIQDWFTEAEHIATCCSWTKDQMKRNFSQRFKSLALAFQQELDRSTQRNVSYDEWKEIIIKEFKDPAENEFFKQDLAEIKQKEKERVRDFKARIEKTFIKGYGEDAFKSTEPITASIRNDILKNAFQNGLKASLESGFWNKIEPDHKYEDAVKIAMAVESVLGKRQMVQSSAKARDSAINAISLHQDELTSDVERLKLQFEGMKSSLSENRKSDARPSISAITPSNPGNTIGYTRYSTTTGTPNLSVNSKAVHFPGPSNNYRGRSTDRSLNYTRERSLSPFNRDKYNTSPNGQNRFYNRPLSRERTPASNYSSRNRSLSREREHPNERSPGPRPSTPNNYRNPTLNYYQTPPRSPQPYRPDTPTRQPNQNRTYSNHNPHNRAQNNRPFPPARNPNNHSRNNSTVCYRCNQQGHIRSECRVLPLQERRTYN